MRHLYRMCKLWKQHSSKLEDKDAVFFAIIYHDIIYKPKRTDNEEMSLKYFIGKVLPHLKKLSKASSLQIANHILASKHDDFSKVLWKNNKDTQYLLDFDLEVLGTEHLDVYDWYKSGVRQEYKVYPDKLYKPGRKAVLESFLKKDKIYLTPEFKKREKTARINLQNEINSYI